MLEKIVKTRNPFFWIVVHISLGAVCAILKVSFIFWFFLASLGSILMITQGGKRKRVVNLLYFVTYFSSFELLARMTKAYKYNLPWEFGKYLVFFGAVFAILFLGSRKGLLGILLILLLLPAVFFSGVDYEITWHNVVFNAFGPACVALVIFAFQDVMVTKAEFRSLLKLIFYPALSVLVYVVIETPDLTSMEFELGANFAATAGFGSNQVSSFVKAILFFMSIHLKSLLLSCDDILLRFFLYLTLYLSGERRLGLVRGERRLSREQPDERDQISKPSSVRERVGRVVYFVQNKVSHLPSRQAHKTCSLNVSRLSRCLNIIEQEENFSLFLFFCKLYF